VLDLECFAAETSNEMWIWHQRYELQKLEYVACRGYGVCEGCCAAKQARKAFKHDLPVRSKQEIGIIFSYFCGPFEEKSLGSNSYFVSFIDEYTRYMWIYLITKKSD
jgi:hypothetical protein